MDPATIATSVITILAPYVADAGKNLVKTAGEVGVDKVKQLLAFLKERFTGDESATKDLTRFESNPQAFTPALQATIVEKVQANPAFAADLERHVNDAAPFLEIVQKVTQGTNVVGVDVDALRSGHVTITQEIGTANGATAFRGKTIG